MHNKTLSFLICFMFCFDSFGINCDKDNGFVKIDEGTIGYNMYNKYGRADKIQNKDGAEWVLKNKDSDNLNIYGTAFCSNSDSNNYFKQGKFCWCKINVIDDYKVDSNWKYVKEFYEPKSSQKEENEASTKLCIENCSSYCQQSIARIIKEVNGYYACDKIIYRIENPKCGGYTFFNKIREIKVFNDTAEIIYEKYRKVLTKNGEVYNGEGIILKIMDNKLFFGSKITQNMEECTQ